LNAVHGPAGRLAQDRLGARSVTDSVEMRDASSAEAVHRPAKIVRWVLIGLMTSISGALVFGYQIGSFAHPHAIRVGLFAATPLVIQVHTGFAFTAVLLGAVQLTLPKGTRFHRANGRLWALIMLTVAGLSLFIRPLGSQQQFLYIFTIITLLGVPVGVIAAALGRVKLHRNIMLFVFWVCLVAGAVFAFMPGRLLWRLVFG
jgi:uncharacterized membrane protein